MAPTRRPHGRIAWCYDELAALYSLGQVGRAKLAQLDGLTPGARVLYAGVGRGSDAVAAVRAGARVTAIDCSPAMLRRLRARLAREGLEATVREQDLFEHVAPPGGYDAVALNFVLNVFEPALMRRGLAHLAGQLAPGGQLWIADFAPPTGGAVARAWCRAYFRLVDVAGFALGLAPLHPLYDYGPELEALGFAVEVRRGFRPFATGPPLYESLKAARRSRAESVASRSTGGRPNIPRSAPPSR